MFKFTFWITVHSCRVYHLHSVLYLKKWEQRYQLRLITTPLVGIMKTCSYSKSVIFTEYERRYQYLNMESISLNGFWRGTGRIFSLVGQVKRRERGRALKVRTWSSGSLCLNARLKMRPFLRKREMQPQGYQEEGCNFYRYLGCATCGHTSWA